ncbi:hypothetical protein ESCO_004049 [Escovopsis weberi]|uniref:Uncharacterized protein n=1 Tax=Escovopsis weberi TaxID=150374 RepID=A0A0M9VVE5_ESCWE|nr:hypothetical protein ESCO_004049 [Escovopsis weberi]
MKFCETLGGRKKSRDLHIRKISFSGSSVSSGSFSSTSSCSTARGDDSSSLNFDPLALHPTFHAPPRLHNRPFIPLDGRRYQDVSAFCDDSEDDHSDVDSHPSLLHHNQRRRRYHTQAASTASDEEDRMGMMPSAAAAAAQEESCFFAMHLAPRPQLPPSRWSESTIATMQTFDEFGAPTSASMLSVAGGPAACAGEGAAETTRTQRPGMKHMDTFEHFVKRGGWKRRGIVFHSEDMAGAFAELR